MVKLMIPFKVRLEMLADEVYYKGDTTIPFYDRTRCDVPDELTISYSILIQGMWTVVAIKPNPENWKDGRFERVQWNDNVGHVHQLYCDLFLLFRDGETPFWYPSIYCKAVEE